MRPSLRKRLLATLLTTTTALWLLLAYASYQDTLHEVNELFDAQLAQAARTMLQISSHEVLENQSLDEAAIYGHSDSHHDVSPIPELGYRHRYEQKLIYQLWHIDSEKLLAHSPNAPEVSLNPAGDGYSDRNINGRHWRIFTLSDPSMGLRIHMGQSFEIRNELSAYMAGRKLALLLVGLPLLGGLVIWAVGRGLAPLRQLTQRLEAQQPTRLQSLDEREVPDETLPLVKAINTLFERLQHAFEREKRFTADAAHELRTPLAALKVQAQVLERGADEQQRQGMASLLRSVDRASRLVDQLLTLARLDPEQPLVSAPVDAEAIAGEVVAELTPFALEKEIEIALEAEPVNLRANGDALYALLRNLVENAINYTPNNGQVTVCIGNRDGRPCIQVNDSGPGIPEEKRSVVLQRFTRLEQGAAVGSGLGLSIVQRIASHHQATLKLNDSPLGGLQVEVCFPA